MFALDSVCLHHKLYQRNSVSFSRNFASANFRSCEQHHKQLNILQDYQHGFRKRRSFKTQLIITINETAKSLDNRSQDDVLIQEFSTAFDTVPHARLLKKPKHFAINGLVHGWIKSWLMSKSQRVIINGASSNKISVRSGVLQGTFLGPLMFLIYENDIGENITSNMRLFADDSLLYCAIDIPQDCLFVLATMGMGACFQCKNLCLRTTISQ